MFPIHVSERPRELEISGEPFGRNSINKLCSMYHRHAENSQLRGAPSKNVANKFHVNDILKDQLWLVVSGTSAAIIPIPSLNPYAFRTGPTQHLALFCNFSALLSSAPWVTNSAPKLLPRLVFRILGGITWSFSNYNESLFLTRLFCRSLPRDPQKESTTHLQQPSRQLPCRGSSCLFRHPFTHPASKITSHGV